MNPKKENNEYNQSFQCAALTQHVSIGKLDQM